MDPSTDIGPLATGDVLRGLQEQVDKTVQMGARVLLGGKRMNRQGNFFEPTVLSEIPKGSPAHEDELFGPVASIFRAKGMADAIGIANDCQFGLPSYPWPTYAQQRQLF